MKCRAERRSACLLYTSYLLGEELSEQGYHASYVYCDAQMMEIAKAQMELLEGRVPEKANEIVVSKYFLSTYGNNAKIGDTVTLDTESFHGDYVVTGITDSVNEKEANTCAIILSNAALTEWNGFDPAGYRAYVHFKNSDQMCIRDRRSSVLSRSLPCSPVPGGVRFAGCAGVMWIWTRVHCPLSGTCSTCLLYTSNVDAAGNVGGGLAVCCWAWMPPGRGCCLCCHVGRGAM